jgi:hypothetical protein
MPAASMPMASFPTATATMMPRLKATPTAAGSAKRAWICSSAVKTADSPCSARAGAISRSSRWVISARSGSRL